MRNSLLLLKKITTSKCQQSKLIELRRHFIEAKISHNLALRAIYGHDAPKI